MAPVLAFLLVLFDVSIPSLFGHGLSLLGQASGGVALFASGIMLAAYKIKIDRVFISNLERNPQSEAIIRAVIGLGRGLDLPITAEGVETQAQLDFLVRESCQEIQGYLIGRPEPIANYAELVGRTVAEQFKALAS